MKKFTLFIMTAVAAISFAACGGAADNKPANNANAANANSAKPTAAAPTKDALMTLEKSAYEAWKTKDAKFWDPFLTDNFVGFGATGRMDRAAAIKQYSGADCEVKSYALSDEQMTAVGADAAIITYKATYDGTCGGQKLPAQVWAAGVYVRSGDKWKGAFHAETPIIDPKAPPAKPAAPTAAKPAAADTKPADALTEALLAVEKKGWEAWKNRDAKGIEAVIMNDIVVIESLGQRFDKAGALKAWTEPKCEIKSFSLTDAAGVSLTKDAGLLTFKGTADGKCDGTALTPLWGTGVFVKDGENWKFVMVFNTPA